MNQTETKQLKAGPETDALVGKVIGWVPGRMCRLHPRPSGGGDCCEYRVTRLDSPGRICKAGDNSPASRCKHLRVESTPPFSTDIAAAEKALEWLEPHEPCLDFSESKWWCACKLPVQLGDDVIGADAVAIPLAVARVVVLLAETLKREE